MHQSIDNVMFSQGDLRRAEHKQGWFMRNVCRMLIVSMLNAACLPLVHAEIARANQAAAEQSHVPQAAEQYAALFDQLDVLASSHPDLRMTRVFNGGMADALEQHAEALRAEWDALRTTWRDAGVALEIVDRQLELEAQFAERHARLLELLRALDAGDASAQPALQAFLAAERPVLARVPVDVESLPWQVEPAGEVVPALSDAAIQQKLDAPAIGSRQQDGFSRKQALGLSASLPGAWDLAPTVEAPQTAEIKMLAASLGNNPHRIYQWVHDNIHYFPSHGSIQGAQDTLDKRRGNAFDTNSLLIALLRSAGIPARYVYGTVEMPIAQVQNWVGGAETPGAAQQILAQGGVPTAILVKGGRDHAMRLEHVWVEAYIQYHPGRGAKHVVGQSVPDSWVPMDGSFKQYTFAEGMALESAVPFDADALMSAAQQGVTDRHIGAS